MSACPRRFVASLVGLMAITLSGVVVAQSKPSPNQSASNTPHAVKLPIQSAKPHVGNEHPLASVIEYARKEKTYMAETVRDFTCRLVKRERINGFLQEQHFIEMQVREPYLENGQAVQPLSIYLHFLGPKTVANRRVLFVEGQNEGKMLVRNGGRHFDYVVAQIDPNGDNAKDETLVPITDIGFDRLLGRMIEVLERHRELDTSGQNTKVDRIAGAKINDRVCTVIRITHPTEADGLEFHLAHVFVDNELHAPLRVDYSGFPRRAGAEPPLIAEYTYTNLKVNVGLQNGAFNRARLRSQE